MNQVEEKVASANQHPHTTEQPEVIATQQLADAAPPGQEYVDPYLFETGYFESREEYEELMRTAKIKPRVNT